MEAMPNKSGLPLTAIRQKGFIMFFNITDDNNFEINGENLVFKKTAYEGGDFSISVSRPSRQQSQIYMRKATTREGVSSAILTNLLWKSHVNGWNLKDCKGQNILFNETNKEAFIEKEPTFSNLVATAILDPHNQPEPMNEKEKKISKSSSDGE